MRIAGGCTPGEVIWGGERCIYSEELLEYAPSFKFNWDSFYSYRRLDDGIGAAVCTFSSIRMTRS